MGVSQLKEGSSPPDFLDSLLRFSKEHRAQRWEGTLSDFLKDILPKSPASYIRTSHEYIWDMLLWHGRASEGSDTEKARELFKRELFGVDEPLGRVVDYFKAAAAGSDVGRRLLLLLGPPSGGKSTLAILLKRGLEEYSRTDEGALYAIKGSPLRESPLNLIPTSLRPEFRETYGVSISGELSPWARDYLDRECEGDYLRVPVERIFLSEAARCGIGTYAPHDPSTADIADLVGSVDLSKVARVGDEGDPRAWSWSGAVYAASRGVLEMIEILKVKREFLYLLLTLTQEKNVKVARFPLIYLDETILAHTNLAEFNRFLQEKENEALLDRMVIIKVPYALSYKDEARIYKKLVYGAPAFRNTHLDPHVLHLAAVFAILTRHTKPEREGLDLPKKVRMFAGEAVEGFSDQEAARLRSEAPDEGLSGVSPRFVINALSTAITRGNARSLTSMELLLALKDAIESDARIDAKQKKTLVRPPRDGAQGVLQSVGQGGRPSGLVRLLPGRGAAASGEVPRRDRGLARSAQGDGSHDRREPCARRALHALGGREDQGLRVRQAIVPPGGHPQGHGRVQGGREVPARRAMREFARPSSSIFSRSGATCCASSRPLRGPTMKRARKYQWCKNAS